jgi:2-hydroxy-3-keto-5-methylthiopentenyl-1-phosphate phosphatase
LIDATYQRVREAYFTIKQQLAVMRPYIEKPSQEIRERIQDEFLIMKQHKLHFIAWLKDLNIPIGDTLEEK